MTTFEIVTTLMSLALFAGFILLGVCKFGLLPSYSAYSSKWSERFPKWDTNVWSIVTVIVAMLLAPALIEQGDGNVWQFLGFFAPVYLITVAMTPKWETDAMQHRVHVVGAVFCAIAALLWLVLVRHQPWIPILTALAALGAGYATVSVRKSLVFWAEIAMFASVYLSILT